MESAWKELSTQLAKLLPSAHEHMLNHSLINQGTKRSTLPLNRYNNIIPLDTNLVTLLSKKYINASHIQLPNTTHPFIISQSPMHPNYYGPDCTQEFWQMIHQENPSTIVNLAKVENGYAGASLYWPLNVNDVYQTETHTIECLAIETLEKECLIRRRLKVSAISNTTTKTNSNSNNNTATSVELNHYHFEQWPNYDIATSSTSTIKLLQHILHERKELTERNGATLCHCSGGVGRSGTFVAAVAAVEQLLCQEENKEEITLPLRLYEIVRSMREQRHPWMVEGYEQFAFCGRLVEEMMAMSVTTTEDESTASKV